MTTLNDKIKGAIFGYALGDALGLGTEFMTKQEISVYYPQKLRHFNQIIRDAHRVQWENGDWTCDTDFVVVALESILREKDFDIIDICKSYKKHFSVHPGDMIPNFRLIMRDPDWENNPRAICHKIWHQSGCWEATNESLGRALVVALTTPSRLLNERVRNIVQVTHDDIRCVVTTEVMAQMMHSLLFHDKEIPYAELHEFISNNDPRIASYLKEARVGTLADLNLDDDVSFAYTRKSMAAALWVLWHCDNAEDMIYKLVDEGGDADTNAALAGALAGLKYGYDALPAEKEKLNGKDYLEDLSNRVAAYVEANYKEISE